ncbi:MAG TPA: polyphenol oxidase family protein [Thermoanaerobaculia bacterium]|nr:polyphenol oxidase family protein [Thermoanaerobaculia bacterium]
MARATSLEAIEQRWAVDETSIGRVVIPSDLPPGIALFYTTIDFHGRLDAASSAALREVMQDRFGVDATLASCHQVHGTRAVKAVCASDWSETSGCDALFSDESGVALAIKMADCLPVTLIDAEHHAIANIHSGWRGTAASIVKGTLTALRDQTTFASASALAYLGPSIRSCCFEVGEEVIALFAQRHEGIERYVDRTRGPRPFLDTVALTIDGLIREGIARERTFDSKICTRCDGSIFHSYRRDAALSGRNLAVAAQRT